MSGNIENARNWQSIGPYPPMPEDRRQELIAKIHAICDWRRIDIADGDACFKIPVDEFLQHVDPKDLNRLSWILSSIATLLAGEFGRADRATIDRIDPGILNDAVNKFEHEVARCFIADVSKAGVDLLLDKGVKKRRRRIAIDRTGVSHAKPDGEARKAIKRSRKLGGSVRNRVSHRKSSSKKRGAK